MKVRLDKNIHKSINPYVKDVLVAASDYGISFEFLLKDRIEERGMTVRECAELTGLRLETISELMTGKKASVNLHHIAILMMYLRISDMRELITIHMPERAVRVFKEDSTRWIDCQVMPKNPNLIGTTVSETMFEEEEE